MSKLSDMLNIGKELESQLKKVGIETCQELIKLVSKEAFTRIRLIGDSICINRLYALEGAIQGIRWRYLSQEDKASLKAFYQTLT